ncbi:hypothetical protein DdX_17492 [Ditylenchus destructor]|uniref:Uncharacterized protein n=1 Tax=Ditylenchus destructor TaxID=166010 RepID=A0AAD4MMW9_9BILA|nr:hypothetical protein DdX_17492 [Ditylenchus destructor]
MCFRKKSDKATAAASVSAKPASTVQQEDRRTVVVQPVVFPRGEPLIIRNRLTGEIIEERVQSESGSGISDHDTSFPEIEEMTLTDGISRSKFYNPVFTNKFM